MPEYNPKEYEKAFYFIQRIISSCDCPVHIQICKELINQFKKKKFKKDIPTQKEQEDYTAQLEHGWHNKNNAIRWRVADEKKKSKLKVRL